ncbi:MAG: alpha/beta fold hydrolase [Myxococcaceae bacterium]
MSTTGGTARLATPAELAGTDPGALVVPAVDEIAMLGPQFLSGLLGRRVLQIMEQLKLSGALPKGEGRLVMSIQGYGDGGEGTKFVEGILKDLDYNVVGPGFDRNVGDPRENYKRLIEQLHTVTAGGERAMVFGHSYGGVFARAAGADYPELVEGVARAASPRGGISAAYSGLGNLMRRTMGRYGDAYDQFGKEAIAKKWPPGVRLHAYAFQGDAVLPLWKQFDPDPKAVNWVIPGTHVGGLRGMALPKALAGPDGFFQEP